MASLANHRQRFAKFPRQHDVAVRIAQQLVPRNFLRSGKQIIRSHRPQPAPFYLPLVPQPKFHAYFLRSLIVPEENHLGVRVQQRPTLQRVALRYPVVPPKWLSRRKKSNHPARFFFLSLSHAASPGNFPHPVSGGASPPASPGVLRLLLGIFFRNRKLFLKLVLKIPGVSVPPKLSFRGIHLSKNSLLGISVWSFCALSFLSQSDGCLHHPKPLPSVTISPNPVAFPATALGASSTPIPVTVTNSGTAALIISSIVPGGSNPGDFTSTNTCSGPVASMGTCTITVTFIPTASGPRSETITLTDNASDSPQVIQVTGTANANAIAISLTPPQSAIATDQAVQFTATGDPAGVNFSLAAFTNSGPGAAAPAGTINATGYYTPPPGSPSLYVIVTATSKTDPTKSASATVNVVAPGLFTNTNNVQVAQYSVLHRRQRHRQRPVWPHTTYGLTTWTLPNTGQFGGPTPAPSTSPA